MAHGHHEHDGYKPWKNYSGASSIHNQPIHGGETGGESQSIDTRNKNGFLHLGRINQHMENMKREKQENKAIKQLNKDRQAKESRDKQSAIEGLDFEEKELAKQKDDLRHNRISMSEFNKLNVGPQEKATLPSGTIKGELSEHEKNRISGIDKSIGQFNAQIYKINQEKKNPDSDYTKADQKGKEAMEKVIEDHELEIKKLSKERDEINNVQHRGFAGVGNQQGTENYKGEIIPNRNRNKQERQYNKDKSDQYGEKVPTMGDYQKKRKYYNEFTGKYEWTSELSDYKKNKYEKIARQGESDFIEDHDPVEERENFQHNNQVREPSPEAQDTGYVFLGSGVTRN